LIGVASLLVMFAGLWLKASLQKQGWDAAPGHCVDRELRKIYIPAIAGAGRGQWTWFWRVVCDYEYLCVHYRVTPEVSAMGFNSEEAAREFLAGRVSPDGTCTLRVDPKHPLRTELFNHCVIGGDAL
jgi:hypothetical protein